MQKPLRILLLASCLLAHQTIFAEKPPPKRADTKPGYWNRPETPEHLYRLIRLRYVGPKTTVTTQGLVPVVMLTPEDGSLSDLNTAEDCRALSADNLRLFIDTNPEVFRLGKRVWLDWKQGIVGSETDTEYYFVRYVCLPMSTVDDLDLVGTQYREAYVKDKSSSQGELIKENPDEVLTLQPFGQYEQKEIAAGYATTLEPGDQRSAFRYDPVRFFQRFEKYGITQMLVVPDTKGKETWQDNAWNTMFKVMPLGETTSLDISGENSNQSVPEAAQKIYNNLRYRQKIKLWYNP